MYAFLAGASSAVLGALALGFFAAFPGPVFLSVSLYPISFVAGMSGGYKLYQRRKTGTTVWLALACALCGVAAGAASWMILEYSQGYRGLAPGTIYNLAGYMAAGLIGTILGARLRIRYESIS
jgi:hypothetical protein